MVVGAGTILDIDQVDAALAAGADFIVAPGTNPRIVGHVLGSGKGMLPGVLTPTEIEANLARGLYVMKLFPVSAVGGLAYLRSLYGPYRDVQFVPTGGVSQENLQAYFSQPNVIAVGGSWIASRQDIEAGALRAIRTRAREAALLVAAGRDGQPVST
jgi:2-dehydro-3-deoxyphosphogluconate aldolase/(4S)-4-hydroxy-2-oxoglutarate aldolase